MCNRDVAAVLLAAFAVVGIALSPLAVAACLSLLMDGQILGERISYIAWLKSCFRFEAVIKATPSAYKE